LHAAAVKAALASLPLRSFQDIFASGPVLILAPHPDDESLGCGGMIATACALNVPVHVAILTDGGGSHPGSRAFPPARLAELRAYEARTATAELGLPPANLLFMDVKDTEAPHAGAAFDALVVRLAALAHARDIATICASWQHDPHGDHLAAALLAAATCRRIGARHLSFPVWAWTLPDTFELPGDAHGGRLDIAPHLPAKRRAIAAHASQYTDLITDSPDAFRMTPAFMALFDRPWEVFIEAE
jgi:LmbE family N-acetylglucosaminyl deacetylase